MAKKFKTAQILNEFTVFSSELVQNRSILRLFEIKHKKNAQQGRLIYMRA